LFEERGYVPTTVEAVAERAGVALKTVYLAFQTKGGLLRGAWDLALKGDLTDAPVAARAWYREVLDERGPQRKLELYAHHSRVVKERLGDLFAAIRTAATVDGDAASLWQLIQDDFWANQREIVCSFPDGALRAELDVDAATDLLWTTNHPDVWLLLHRQRGWDPDAYEAWLARTSCEQLLARPRRPR
jgi:AcrR family transcriptional regulator